MSQKFSTQHFETPWSIYFSCLHHQLQNLILFYNVRKYITANYYIKYSYTFIISLSIRYTWVSLTLIIMLCDLRCCNFWFLQKWLNDFIFRFIFSCVLSAITLYCLQNSFSIHCKSMKPQNYLNVCRIVHHLVQYGIL